MMSGGSYNYLCHADVEQLFNKIPDLEDMADRLSALGYASDAARETMEALLIIRQYEDRVTVISERLQGVWKAVEWWDSCDSDEDGVKTALERYRGIGTSSQENKSGI